MTIWNLIWILLWTPRKGRRVALSVDGHLQAFSFTVDSHYYSSVPKDVLILCSDTASTPDFARNVRVSKLDDEIQGAGQSTHCG